jgi:hypothetical protein
MRAPNTRDAAFPPPPPRTPAPRQDDLIEALRSEGRKQAMNRQAAAHKRSNDPSRARSGGMSDDAGGEATAEGADTTAGAGWQSCCKIHHWYKMQMCRHR